MFSVYLCRVRRARLLATRGFRVQGFGRVGSKVADMSLTTQRLLQSPYLKLAPPTIIIRHSQPTNVYQNGR